MKIIMLLFVLNFSFSETTAPNGNGNASAETKKTNYQRGPYYGTSKDQFCKEQLKLVETYKKQKDTLYKKVEACAGKKTKNCEKWRSHYLKNMNLYKSSSDKALKKGCLREA